MLGQLDKIARMTQLRRWLAGRLRTGFNGRVNKDADVCYTWWIGATIRMTDDHVGDSLLAKLQLGGVQSFVSNAQFRGFGAVGGGGIGKEVGDLPDLLHTYMGLAGLTVIGASHGLQNVDAELNLPDQQQK